VPEPAWPTSAEVHAAVAERVLRLLDQYGGPVATVATRALSAGQGLLSERPHSLTCVLVPGACIAAGGTWQAALWPAAAAELVMAAADVLDDVADLDPGTETSTRPGVLLTAAAGMLTLASVAALRVVEDDATPMTAVALGQLLGDKFAQAANGQAVNLAPNQRIDALAAYRQAAAKSGPLGSLIARLGARTATDDERIVDLLGEFGRRLAVYSQLINDARDAAPGALQKADVRAGAHTVPLAFTHSAGAPPELSEDALAAWEQNERARILAGGGVAAAQALAEAERLRAVQILDTLEGLGRGVAGLRALLG
jgi:geranylgeranyl pyrophosphate synthase